MSDTFCTFVALRSRLVATIVMVGRDHRRFESGAVYHLTGHGVDGLEILADDVDCHDFVLRLGRVATCSRLAVDAACLMGTHYHLICRPALEDTSAAMQILHGSFARALNARRLRRGAVWESRFRVTPIDRESHHLDAIRYVALNPVRAGLVERPADWQWSTYGQLLGKQPVWPFFEPRRVVELFGSLDGLRRFVETGV